MNKKRKYIFIGFQTKECIKFREMNNIQVNKKNHQKKIYHNYSPTVLLLSALWQFKINMIASIQYFALPDFFCISSFKCDESFLRAAFDASPGYANNVNEHPTIQQ